MQSELIKRTLEQMVFRENWEEMKRNSHSQFFEDLILSFVFEMLKSPCKFYIDIGAYDGITYSNTMLFYKRGARGINVEPMEHAFNFLKTVRPEDTNVNVAISNLTGEIDFFKSEIDMCASLDFSYVKKFFSDLKKIEKKEKIKVKCLSIMDFVHRYVPSGKDIDLLSIDTKGNDKLVFDGFIAKNILPKVLCMETGIGFTQKNSELQRHVMRRGYSLHSDTFTNSIFVRQDLAKTFFKGI